MLMPAIRAMCGSLSLPLLVPGVLADHEDRAVAANDLALLAHRLDRRSYLHDPFPARVNQRRRLWPPLEAAATGRGCARTHAYAHRTDTIAEGCPRLPRPETPMAPRFLSRRAAPGPRSCERSRSPGAPHCRAG